MIEDVDAALFLAFRDVNAVRSMVFTCYSFM